MKAAAIARAKRDLRKMRRKEFDAARFEKELRDFELRFSRDLAEKIDREFESERACYGLDPIYVVVEEIGPALTAADIEALQTLIPRKLGVVIQGALDREFEKELRGASPVDIEPRGLLNNGKR
jgi:hypothetical protein